VYVLVLALAAGTLLRLTACSTLPADDTLIARFVRSEAEFTRLATTPIERLGGEFQTAGPSLGIVRMTHKLGVADGWFFEMAARFSDGDDFETNNFEKGYVYTVREPAPIVASLDGAKIARPGIVYRRLAENWYLYYEWSISRGE